MLLTCAVRTETFLVILFGLVSGISLLVSHLFLKKGTLAKLAATSVFFQGALRPSWKGTRPLAAVAAVKIEAWLMLNVQISLSVEVS